MFSRTVNLFFWMGVAAVAGYWLQPNYGHLLGAFFVCLFTVIKDLWKGQKIKQWLRHNNVQEPPQMDGIWGDLIDRMRRILNEQRKQTQNEAQKLQDFLLAIQASPNGVVLIDPEGRIEWCNQTAALHLGMDAKRDLMQHVVHLVRDPVFKKYFSSESHDGEAIIDGRSGSLQKTVKLSVQLHNYGENRQLLLTRDVTTIAQADDMRRDFVANVSHEIRTPLTVMSGFIETLQSLNLSKDEQEKYLDLMSVQASRMQDLVNDLLILSQLEGSTLPSINEPVSLQGLMSSIESEARSLSAAQLFQNEAPQVMCFEMPEGVHLSGGVGIGGVLEPLQATPVIVEDGCFIGSRCIVVEGVVVEKEAVLGANVVLTQSTKIIDVSGPEPIEYRGRVPSRSVVIPGSYTKEFPAGSYQVGCALIIGKRKPSTDLKTSLNDALRDFNVAV
jgi:two-component system phosphate regulon sensor histidine kinase PhoR